MRGMWHAGSITAIAWLALVAPSVSAAQGSVAKGKLQTVPDAQIESDVLRAIAAKPELAKQAISSSTVYGVVTLTGSVQDEATRSLAEDVVSRTAGVSKVIDELTLGSGAAVAQGQGATGTPPSADPDAQGTTPLLQSDGTMASPEQQQGVPAGQERQGSAEQNTPAQNQPTEMPGQDGGNSPESSRYPGPSQPYPGSPQSGASQAPGYPPVPPTYPAPGRYPPRTAMPSGAGQPAGVPVLVYAGTSVLIRLDSGIDSGRAQPGAPWIGTVVRDVVSGGYVVIPRGAEVQGQITDSSGSGALSGHADLALQLTAVTLEGNTYPLASTSWQRAGGDKTVRTVNSALGLGAVGAIIGGVAGGGAGAAIGAGVGGAAGVGASAAAGSTRILLPPESVLSFQLAENVTLPTVSQAERARLAATQPAAPGPVGPAYGRPGVPPPPPYGAYYGYPYPYGRVYYGPYPSRGYRVYPYRVYPY